MRRQIRQRARAAQIVSTARAGKSASSPRRNECRKTLTLRVSRKVEQLADSCPIKKDTYKKSKSLQLPN